MIEPVIALCARAVQRKESKPFGRERYQGKLLRGGVIWAGS